MGLFDALGLSGTPAAQQAQQANAATLANLGVDTNALYNQYQQGALGQLGSSRQEALKDLLTGQTGALGAVGNVSTAPLTDAIGALSSGVGAVQGGAAGAADAARAGVAAYDPLASLGQSYQPAIDTYYSALGLTDPSKATAAFHTSPGYQASIDQATKAAGNKAASLGVAGGGNTLAGIGNLAQTQFETTQWQPWMQQLAGFLPLQANAVSGAASGRAGADATLANILRAGGTDTAAAYGALAGGYGGLFQGQRGLAGDTAAIYGTYAPAQAGLETGYGTDYANILGNVTGAQAQTARDVAQGTIAGNNQVAGAKQADVNNYWGAIDAGVGALGKAYAPAPTYNFKTPTA